MSDAVLCVKVCANNKLLAVSLNDYTIKVFYVDTLKVSKRSYGTVSHSSSILVKGYYMMFLI